MKEQLQVQHLLNKKLMDARRVNPSYSVRAFAKKLGMQPSATNEILKGQRKVSRKLAEKIADKLLLNPTDKAMLLKDFPQKVKRNTAYRTVTPKEDQEFLKLSSEQFSLIAQWIHFAILSLIKTDDFCSDVQWIADRLSQSVSKTQKALYRLEHLKLITKDHNNNYIRTSNPIKTSDDTLNLSLQKSHMMDMELAKEKLLNIDVKNRDFSSLTLPVDPKLLPKAKEILRNAQLQIEELMEQGDQVEVYKLSNYFYPLTKLKQEKS